MKGYSTKYALTQGIQTVEVEDQKPDVKSKYVFIKDQYDVELEYGINFFESADAAEIAAKQMAKRRVINLNKQLDKVKPLTRKPRWSNK